MLPRSCLRLALSKSNSSTRLPRTTTTRVSSGWVASISILLAIDGSSCGALARGTPPPHGQPGAALQGARRNGGGILGRGPIGSAQRRADWHRAAPAWHGGDAADRSVALGPWPLTCDGRQPGSRRDFSLCSRP